MSVAVEERLRPERWVFWDGKFATVASQDGACVVLSSGEAVRTSEARAALLPDPGQPVLLFGREVVWLGLTTQNGHPQCLALDGDTVVVRSITTAEAVVERPGEKELPARACEALVRQWTQHEAWTQALNEAANEYADDNDLCERYDRFMEDNGLKGREKDFSATLTVTVNVTITGRNFDDAASSVDVSDVREWLDDHLDWELEED